jgi:hypothetical protein
MHYYIHSAGPNTCLSILPPKQDRATSTCLTDGLNAAAAAAAVKKGGGERRGNKTRGTNKLKRCHRDKLKSLRLASILNLQTCRSWGERRRAFPALGPRSTLTRRRCGRCGRRAARREGRRPTSPRGCPGGRSPASVAHFTQTYRGDRGTLVSTLWYAAENIRNSY